MYFLFSFSFLQGWGEVGEWNRGGFELQVLLVSIAGSVYIAFTPPPPRSILRT